LKIFVDDNIPRRTALKILQRHPGSMYALEHPRFRTMADAEIFRFVVEKRYVLLTHDKDFSNILKFPPGGTPGIIVVREDGLKEATMRRRLFLFLESTNLRALQGMLTVFSARSIRKRES
jgi:predicted nuclease of predicted toxin-antitoxin system